MKIIFDLGSGLAQRKSEVGYSRSNIGSVRARPEQGEAGGVKLERVASGQQG